MTQNGEPSPPSIAAAPDALARILLRLPNWLGDVVMAAPAVAAIARARPDAEIVAQVRGAFVPLAALLPGVHRAFATGRDRTPGDLWRSRRALRAGGFDAAVVFPRSLRAAMAPWLARIPVRVGFGPRLYTHPLRGWRPLREAHRSRYFGALAGAFGAEPPSAVSLPVPEEALAEADRLLLALGRRSERPLVVLEPGASYGVAKCWPAERFGGVAAQLMAQDVDVVTVGTAATRPVERRVAAAAGRGLLRAAGRTDDLRVLMGVLRRANAMVTNDTGPMHLAAALGTPMVALFGASDPVVSGPSGAGPRRLIYDPEPCSPCFLRTCPVPGHPCLSKIGVERVLREVSALLAA